MNYFVNEKWLFEFTDNSISFYTEAADFKSAVMKLAEYTRNNDPLFAKALKSMQTDKDVVSLYNRFSSWHEIETVYQISCIKYSKNQKDGESDG